MEIGKQRLIKTIELWREVTFPYMPKGDLMAEIDEIAKRHSYTEGKVIDESIRDIVESTLSWTDQKVIFFDTICKQRNAAPLSELRIRYGRRFRRLLKAETLKLKDYEFLKPLLDNYTEFLTSDQIAKLRELLSAFEKVNLNL